MMLIESIKLIRAWHHHEQIWIHSLELYLVIPVQSLQRSASEVELTALTLCSSLPAGSSPTVLPVLLFAFLRFVPPTLCYYSDPAHCLECWTTIRENLTNGTRCG